MNKNILLLIILALLSLLITSCGQSPTTPAQSTSIDVPGPAYSTPYTPPKTIITTAISPLPTRQTYSPSTTNISTETPGSSYTLPTSARPIPSPNSPDLFFVSRVVDGDTIEALINGQSKKVRYIGINTPETEDPNKPVEPYGKEASDKNRDMVEGKYVKLEKDISDTDKYGRLLRYVYVNDVFVNAELIKMGYANAYSSPPDVKYQSLFAQLEKEARDNNRGLWSLTTPSATKSSSPTIIATNPQTSKSLTLVIESITSPVKRGDNAKLIAQTLAGAQCEIAVYYKNGKSTASGLSPKTTDANGSVYWTWTVGSSTEVGSWNIEVTATLNGASVKQTTYFTVQ
jgi:endonuclease YncB( thermonuclease family)